eukprot:CFRG7463T1
MTEQAAPTPNPEMTSFPSTEGDSQPAIPKPESDEETPAIATTSGEEIKKEVSTPRSDDAPVSESREGESTATTKQGLLHNIKNLFTRKHSQPTKKESGEHPHEPIAEEAAPQGATATATATPQGVTATATPQGVTATATPQGVTVTATKQVAIDPVTSHVETERVEEEKTSPTTTPGKEGKKEKAGIISKIGNAFKKEKSADIPQTEASGAMEETPVEGGTIASAS